MTSGTDWSDYYCEFTFGEDEGLKHDTQRVTAPDGVNICIIRHEAGCSLHVTV